MTERERGLKAGQCVSSEAEDSESKSNSSAFSPWQSTSDHRSIEKVANDTIMQGN